MPEWWSYGLSSFLLFSPQTYYRLLERYNQAIWPTQLVFLVLGLAIPVLLRWGGAQRDRLVAAILAAAWLWVAWSFHLRHYQSINWAAVYFAGAFAVEAVLLAGAGVVLGRLRFQMPGKAADPTVAATLALAALASKRMRWLLMPIPLLWCAVSGATLLAMKSPDFPALPLTALLLALLGKVPPKTRSLPWRRPRRRESAG